MEHEQEMIGQAWGCWGQERAREHADNLALGRPWRRAPAPASGLGPTALLADAKEHTAKGVQQAAA